MVLQQYSDVIGKIAGSFGVLFLLVPGSICIQIIRQGNTENVSPLHFIFGGCITLIKLRQGQLINSAAIVSSTAVGLALFTIYFCIYMIYCDQRRRVGSLLLKCLIIPLLMIAYSFVDVVDRAEKVFGTGYSVIIFCLMSMPLFRIKTVVKQKHTGDLSLAMALFGTIHATLWFLYSLTLGKYIEIFSRLITCLMVFPQVVMFLIYPMPESRGRQKVRKT